MQRDINRILIVRTDRIGDVILTLPMAQALKSRFPRAHVAMLIQRYTAELVEDNPHVDQILFYDDGERTYPFSKLVSTLRRERFDVVFHTHPRLQLALVTWFAGIPVRVGTGYRYYSFLFNRKMYEHRKDALYHELEYNLHLLRAIGCDVGDEKVYPRLDVRPEAMVSVRKILSKLGITDEHQIVILHPGSGRSARDWSAKNFGLLGKKLSELPNVKIIVTGRESEQSLIDDVQSVAGKSVIAMVDRMTLREYAALAKLAALFVGNSTGPLHIAAAVGTPVIGLYPQVTPLSARRWGPYTEKKTIFTPVGKPNDCTKCLNGKMAVCECMETIGVEEVYRAAVKYLLPDSEQAVMEAIHTFVCHNEHAGRDNAG